MIRSGHIRSVAVVMTIAACIASAASVQSTATLATTSRQFPPAYIGYNTQMLRGPAWQAPGFIDSVKRLQPAFLRYPGGTNADYWDWRAGWVLPGYVYSNQFKNLTPNRIRLEDFKYAIDATGAQPVFVVNMLTSTLDSQLVMLRTAKSLGLSANLIELGNEFYLDGDDSMFVKVFPTPESYAAEATRWISAIRSEFPAAQIAYVGADVRATDTGRRRVWNSAMYTGVTGAQAITVHVYPGDGIADGAQPFDIVRILSVPFSYWRNTKKFVLDSLPVGTDVWITEYNLWEKSGAVYGTWAHGLYAAALTLLFVDEPRVVLACCHNLTSGAQFCALFNNSTPFKDSTVTAAPFSESAAGNALRIVSMAMLGAASAQKIVFSNNAPIRNGTDSFPSLMGWTFVKNANRAAVIVNLSGGALTIDTKGLGIQNGRIELLTADPHRVISSPDSLTDVWDTVNSSAVELPAYSMAYIVGAERTGVGRNRLSISDMHDPTGLRAVALRGRLAIEFSLPQSARVRLSIHDIRGSCRTMIADRWMPAGIHNESVLMSSAASAELMCELRWRGTVRVVKVPVQ